MRSFLKWEDKAEILYEEKDMDRNANSFIANIRRFEDMDMDKVCQMIESASRIYTQGSGSTQKLAAQHLKEKFLYQGIFINTIEGASEYELLSEKFTEDDLVIFYSLSGQNEKQIRKMRSAKERGAKIIGIAMHGKGEFYDLADEVLTFQSEEIHTIGYGFLYYPTLHFHIVNEFLTLKYMEHQLKKQETKMCIRDRANSCRTNCICPPGAQHKCTEKRAIPGSTAFVPSVAGLIIAGEVVKDLCKA